MTTIEALKDLLLAGGAGWVLWLLGLLSVGTVAVTLQRALRFRRSGTDVRRLARILQEALENGDAEAAREAMEASRSLAGTVAAAGLRQAARGPKATASAMRSRLALERLEHARGLAFLGTLGNNAPFVGLFGTVIGVIQAFEELGAGAAAHAATAGAAAHVASDGVMSAIAEALVATAVGLAVALPAVVAYNALQRRLAGLVGDAQVLADLVLVYVESDPGATP